MSFAHPIFAKVDLSRVLRVLAVICITGLSAGVSPALGAFPGANGKIAFESDRHGGDSDIWTMNPNRSNLDKLLHNPNGMVQGRTVGEWLAKYWEHLLEPPLEISPFLGRGELCPVVGRVLLAVTENGTVRSCTVAPGTHIYVAMSSAECSTVEPEPFFGGPDLASLRACASAFLDTWVISHSLTIDGRPIDLTPHRHVSPRFTLELPQPNVFDTNETTALAAADGWAVITHPLRPGTHTIEYRARRDEGSGPADGGYTYTINVVPPRRS